MRLFTCLVFAGLIAVPSLSARPVSYPEGWTVILNNEADNSSALLHYTIDPRTSLGMRVEDRTYGNHVFVGGQLNRLVKRWNEPGSQANFYIKTGIGVAHGKFNSSDDDTRLAGFVRASADWEDRRWFVSGDLYAYAVDGQASTGQQARIGVAPYIADYGGLHSWLMVQGDWKQNRFADQGEEAFTVTPLVRFFKGTSLLEIGYSSNDEALVNFIQRF